MEASTDSKSKPIRACFQIGSFLACTTSIWDSAIHIGFTALVFRPILSGPVIEAALHCLVREYTRSGFAPDEAQSERFY